MIYSLRRLSRMSARVEEKCCARKELTRRTTRSGPSAVTHMFKIHSIYIYVKLTTWYNYTINRVDNNLLAADSRNGESLFKVRRI